MTTPLTQGEVANLDAHLPSAMCPSMLDGFLAAVACGPNLVMPDQVLRWVWNSEQTDDEPVIPAIDDLILRHYQGVNDALNDEVYEPQMSDPQAWCRGYLAGFGADMTAWAALTAAPPE